MSYSVFIACFHFTIWMNTYLCQDYSISVSEILVGSIIYQRWQFAYPGLNSKRNQYYFSKGCGGLKNYKN